MDSEGIDNITGVFVLIFYNYLYIINFNVAQKLYIRVLVNRPVKGYQRFRFTLWALKSKVLHTL